MVKFNYGEYSPITAYFAGSGNTNQSASALYVNPVSSTTLVGASTYYFTTFSAPTTTVNGFSGIASTVFIAGAPTTTTGGTGYALNVDSGRVRIGGSLQIPTGAVLNYILTSDAAGNASWAAPAPTGFTGFTNGTVSLPGAYWTSETSTGFYLINTSNIGLSLGGVKYIDYSITSTNFSNTLTLNKGGNTTIANSTFYINPVSTAFSGANNYFFTYLNTPPTTGSTTGTASTLYIAGAPTNATNSYALNVNSGNSIFGGTVSITPSSNQLILGSITKTTISAITPAASRTYTIPDVGGNANFILSTSSSGQTIAGGLTLTGETIISSISGSGNIDFSGSSGTFRTTTGTTTINGPFCYNPQVITTSSTLSSTTGGSLIILNPSSVITVNLPIPVNGYTLAFINISTFIVTISTGNSNYYFNGISSSITTIFMNQNDRLQLICYGTNWYVF